MKFKSIRHLQRSVGVAKKTHFTVTLFLFRFPSPICYDGLRTSAAVDTGARQATSPVTGQEQRLKEAAETDRSRENISTSKQPQENLCRRLSDRTTSSLGKLTNRTEKKKEEEEVRSSVEL